MAARTGSTVSPSTGQLEAQKQTTTLSHMCHLDIDSMPEQYRKTSIICTIGPKTNSVAKLTELYHAGMSIVRMNFSHGSYEYHQSVVDNTRAAEAAIPGAVIAIALDTKGPEIRTGLLKGDQEITLEKGHRFYITTDPSRESDSDLETLYVDYKNLPKVVSPGKLVYVDDGLISLEVLDIPSDDRVHVEVVNSGRLGSRKGVNLPEVKVDLPALSEKDIADLLFGLRNKVDMIFASFIRKASDVHDIRHILGEEGADVKIISKIENHEGVRNFDEILAVSDGIMVARGDLGIEIPPEKVFIAQKMMIAKCNIAGKPVICATQMLESMTFNPRPTRAEVSDVANAVLDGADCVMLSGETAKGAYPIEAVSMMAKTALEAESAVHWRPLSNQLRLHTPTPVSMSECVASSAVTASFESHASAIIVLTLSGSSARLLAKYRPQCPIIGVTRSGHTARCMHLYRGCHPLIAAPKQVTDPELWQLDVDARINEAIAYGKRKHLLRTGDMVVCVQGWRGGSGHTNTMRMINVV